MKVECRRCEDFFNLDSMKQIDGLPGLYYCSTCYYEELDNSTDL